MNYKMVRYTLGVILFFEALFMVVPMLTALCYSEWTSFNASLITAIICIVIAAPFIIKKPKNFEDYSVFETQNVSDFFDVLKAADPFYNTTSSEEYYCDIFYRNALPARLFLAEYDGKAAATAGVMHQFKNISIISDVSVLPHLRRRGLGGAVVAKISQILLSEGKIPTLLCTLPSAKKLYKKIGFKVCGRFCLLSFSQNTKDGR